MFQLSTQVCTHLRHNVAHAYVGCERRASDATLFYSRCHGQTCLRLVQNPDAPAAFSSQLDRGKGAASMLLTVPCVPAIRMPTGGQAGGGPRQGQRGGGRRGRGRERASRRGGGHERVPRLGPGHAPRRQRPGLTLPHARHRLEPVRDISRRPRNSKRVGSLRSGADTTRCFDQALAYWML